MFDVRPGFSGWAQIHGRKDVEWNHRIELNVWYVKHVRFSLDLRIFLTTIFKVLLNKDNENIVSENIITPVVNTIVKTGIKSPYEAGVAFLSNPTKGGYVSSTFGEVRSNSVHKGIDIAKDLGEDVSAALEGEVIYAGYNNGGYGNLIILQHNNNMKTYYAHLSNIYVSVGEIVKKNDLIGAIGSTGNSTGPHLHFELRVDNNPVNPIKYIQQ